VGVVALPATCFAAHTSKRNSHLLPATSGPGVFEPVAVDVVEKRLRAAYRLWHEQLLCSTEDGMSDLARRLRTRVRREMGWRGGRALEDLKPSDDPSVSAV
jgi:hypothetical protein